MAGSRPSFTKRQKERARREKQMEKAQRREQRKEEKAAGSPEGGPKEPVIRYDEDGMPLGLDYDQF